MCSVLTFTAKCGRHTSKPKRRQTSAMIFSFNPFTVLGAIPFHFYFGCLLHTFARASARVSTFYLAHIRMCRAIGFVFSAAAAVAGCSTKIFNTDCIYSFLQIQKKFSEHIVCALFVVCTISHSDYSFFVRATFLARASASHGTPVCRHSSSGNLIKNDPSGQRGAILRGNATRTSVPKRQQCGKGLCHFAELIKFIMGMNAL